MHGISKRVIGIYARLRLVTDLLSFIKDLADDLSWIVYLL